MKSAPLSLTAVTSLVWALLTTPLTTLPLLHLLQAKGGGFARWLSAQPYWVGFTFVALVLVGLPMSAFALGSFGARVVRFAWNPMRGGPFANAAMAIGLVSALLGCFWLVSSAMSR